MRLSGEQPRSRRGLGVERVAGGQGLTVQGAPLGRAYSAWFGGVGSVGASIWGSRRVKGEKMSKAFKGSCSNRLCQKALSIALWFVRAL